MLRLPANLGITLAIFQSVGTTPVSRDKLIINVKVTANLFGLEFCKILKSYRKIAHYIYFVLKKKLFENVFFLRSYCKFCVLRD